MTEVVSTNDMLCGVPRIEDRRVSVHYVAKRVIDAGESPEQVAVNYGLDVADVYRALCTTVIM